MLKDALRLGVKALERADLERLSEQLAFALVGATLGGATLLVPLERPARAAAMFGVLALSSFLFEAFSAGRYLRSHHAFLLRTRSPEATLRQVGRTAASIALARTVRVAIVLASLLPGLVLALIAHHRASASLRAFAENAGAFGACASFVATGILGAFVSRAAAFEGLGPRAAIRRSIAAARRAWPLTLLAELLGGGSVVAVAVAQRIPAAWLVAVLLRLTRDALLSYGMWAKPNRRALVRRTRSPFAVALVIAIVGGSIHAGSASAQQVKLVSPNDTQNAATMPAPASTTTAAGVLVTTGNPTVEKPAALSVDVAQRKAFIEANVRLAAAEDAANEASKRLVEHRMSSIGNMATDTTTEDERLLDEAKKADAIVADRKADLEKAGGDILAKSYGSPYGTLQRNWIDWKNTGSYLLGMAESTPSGAVNAVKGVGQLVASGYGIVTGSSKPSPAPDPDAERQGRLLGREQELQTELDRIKDGAAVNLKEGNWAGENVVGPLVLGEGALAAAGRTGVALRTATLAARESPAADLLANSADHAAALERMDTEALAGLPSVNGSLADRVGQGTPGAAGSGEELIVPNSRKGIYHPQMQTMSCGMACTRMVVQDATGNNVPEALLRQAATKYGFTERTGIRFENLPPLLTEFGTTPIISRGANVGDIARAVGSNNRVIASVPGHVIVVDGVSGLPGSRIFNIRDPNPLIGPNRITEQLLTEKFTGDMIKVPLRR